MQNSDSGASFMTKSVNTTHTHTNNGCGEVQQLYFLLHNTAHNMVKAYQVQLESI